MKYSKIMPEPAFCKDHSRLFFDILFRLHDPVAVIGTGSSVLYANEAYVRLFQTAGSSVFTDLLPDKEAASFHRRLETCRANASGFFMSSRLKRADGKWEAFELRVEPHPEEGGLLFSLHLHSIAALVQEREARAVRELRYQTLAEHASDAFFVHDPKGRLLEVNRRACESLQYTREELLGMSIFDIEQDYQLNEVEKIWDQLTPGTDMILYGHHKRKNGTVFPVEISFGCSVWQGEKLFLGMIRDITERLMAQEKFRRIVEGAPDPIFIQADGIFTYLNPEACRLFGAAKPQELIGTPVKNQVHPDYHAVIHKWICQPNVHQKQLKELCEQRFLRLDGSEVWVEIKGEPIEFEEKQGVLFFVRDTTERKQAQKELWESSERFRVAFEASAAGMCLVGEEGVLLNVNQAMCSIFAGTKEQLEGKCFADLTYPADQEASAYAISQMSSGQADSISIEKRYIRINGEVFWANVSSAPLKNKDGRITHYITQILDVTDRKMMEKELQEKEEFHRVVMDNLPIGIAVNSVSPSVSFTYMNDRFPELYRTTREMLSEPDSFWNAVYEDPIFREEIKDRILSDLESGDPERCAWRDVPITRKGTEVRYINAYNTPVPDSNLMISTVTDVTQRIRDREALLKYTRRLEVLHEIDQAILQGDDSPGKIAAMALSHLNRLLNTKRASIMMLEPDPVYARLLARAGDHQMAAEENGYPRIKIYGDVTLLSKGKMYIAEDTDKTALTDYDAAFVKEKGLRAFIQVPMLVEGKLIGILSLGWGMPRTFEDEEVAISQEVASQIALVLEQTRLRRELAEHAKDLERRVRERTAQYEAANKELEAFSYSVSHDLRAPLRSVDGYVQMLLEDYSDSLDDNGKRICGVISNSAKQMGQLIDDLLSLSRVGRTGMNLVPVDMARLADAIYHELTQENERSAIDMVIAPMPCVPADPALMRQVFLNLIGNAIKFSAKKDKTVIRISAEEKDREIVYSIKDCGAGFDQQYADKLFGVFQRLHSSREFEGTGVGLAIVHRIITRHGGRVWAQGQPGEGAAFYFSLKKGDDHEPV